MARRGGGVRSRAGYWIGGGVIAVGVLGAVLWFVGSLLRLSDEVDDFPRVSVPGEATIELEARKYIVYYESSTAEESVPAVELAITEARTGAPLAISPYSGSLTYSFPDHEGAALATVTPGQAGAFAVRTDSALATSGASVALGRSLAWPILRGILGAFAIGGLLVGAGGTLVAVTAVRRSRARRELTPGSEPGSVTPTDLGGQMTTSSNTGPTGQPRGICFGILLYIVTIGIYGIYWSYKTHEEMKQHTGEGLGGVVGLVIWLLINPVSAFVIPSEVGKMYTRDGQEAPMTGWTGLWLFPGVLLVVPAIVWFVKVQGALNRYWEGKAQPA
jgi:Domain of unknown function (DUF4234)